MALDIEWQRLKAQQLRLNPEGRKSVIWRRRWIPFKPSCLSKTTCLNEHLSVPPWNHSNAGFHHKNGEGLWIQHWRHIAVNPQSLLANWANNTASPWCLDSYQSSRLEAKAEIKQLQHNHFKTFFFTDLWLNRVITFLISAKAQQFAICTGLCIWFKMRLNIHACRGSTLKDLTTKLLNCRCLAWYLWNWQLMLLYLVQSNPNQTSLFEQKKQKCHSAVHHVNMTFLI